MHILDKFHEEITIFDRVKRHLVLLPIHRAQTRHSEGPFRKKAIKCEVEVLDTPNFRRISLIRLIWSPKFFFYSNLARGV